MTTRKKSDSVNRRAKKTKDAATIARFIEELAWILSNYQNIDFRSIPDQISFGRQRSNVDISLISSHVSKNPNIHFLVGALPQILDDKTIFPSNEDIASFAKEVLELTVPRWEKKSKYEIIGHVLCNTYKLNDDKLTTLVSALTNLVSDSRNAKAFMKEEKKRASNWNEIIRRLSAGNL